MPVNPQKHCMIILLSFWVFLIITWKFNMARVICNLPATQLSKFALGVLTRSEEVFSYVEFEEHTLKTL